MDISKPALSVIVASANAAGSIERCLTALSAQTIIGKMEIIFANCSTDGTAALIEEKFPSVRVVYVSPPGTIPRLRGHAMVEASGDLIALLDTYCRVGPDWAEKMVNAHRQHPEIPVIGGAVVLNECAVGASHPSRMVQWATFLWEYGAFVPPFDDGPSAELTGNNLAYKRSALPEAAALLSNGFWKTFYNANLKERGFILRGDPTLVATLHKPIALREFIISRYHHGRCFGGMRVATGRARRDGWWRALTIPIVPFLTFARQTRMLWPHQTLRPQFLRAAPLLFLFNLSWAWGELNGYVRGPGKSEEHLLY